MPEAFSDRVKRAWNAFTNQDRAPKSNYGDNITYIRPDRIRLSRGNERSIVTSVYNRISLDVAAVSIQHVQTDSAGRFKEVRNSGLNNCLTLDANKDQTGRAFMQDIVMSMFDEGHVAIVPTDIDINPEQSSSYDILTMRAGKVIEWTPNRVKINLYNENNGRKEEIWMRKQDVAIVENPFYSVMNEPNSTLKRLVYKLRLLDVVDEQSSSGKLDLIIQLPYVIKTDARRKQAEERRKDIEMQLSGSKYGIAYTDGTEKITQLNRAVENNLLAQVQSLTDMLYSQLGITTAILDGSADEQTMLNYKNRCIEPIVSAIVDELQRKFLTKTARTQGQTIMYFNDPFKLIPISNIADIADKFTRNEILSSNEIRQIIGIKPIDDPKADELRNKNINAAEGQTYATTGDEAGQMDVTEDPSKNAMNAELAEIDKLDNQIDELEKMNNG